MVSGDISQLDAGGQSIAALTSLNADEIESIDILKDAAAAADLRLARLQRRGDDHDEARRGRPDQRHVQLLHRHPVGRPAAGAVERHGVPGVLQRERRQRRLRRELLRRSRRGRHRERRLAGRGTALGAREQLGAGGQRRQREAGLPGIRQLVRSGRHRAVVRDSAASAAGSTSTSIRPARCRSAPDSPSSGDRNNRVEGDGSGLGIITNAVGESPLVPVVTSSGEYLHPGRWPGVPQSSRHAGFQRS